MRDFWSLYIRFQGVIAYKEKLLRYASMHIRGEGRSLSINFFATAAKRSRRWVIMRVVAVIGTARSGTTVLRQTIGSSRHSFDLGEVFHGQTERDASFFGYVHALGNEEAIYKSPQYWDKAWDRFCQEKSCRLSAKVLCVDAKVEYFPYISRGETLFFHNERTSYVGLERQNIVAQTLSFLSALASNTWSKIKPQADQVLVERFQQVLGVAVANNDRQPLALDPQQFSSRLVQFENLRTRQRVFCNRLGCQILRYEDLFDSDGTISGEAIHAISTVTDLPATDFQREPILEKQGYHEFLERISNLDELHAVAEDLGYREAFELAVADVRGQVA